MLHKQLAFALTTTLVTGCLMAAGVAQAAVSQSYVDPGWRYEYTGAAGAFGTNGLIALDGTWEHTQGDQWDGTKPGDPLSNPSEPIGTAPFETTTSGPAGVSPGGAGAFLDGATDYLRIQDAGNPEAHGWCQGGEDGPCIAITGEVPRTNRRIYFGRDIQDDGALAGSAQRIFDDNGIPNDGIGGVTISFRARIPNSGPLDDFYQEGFDDANFDDDNQDVDGKDFLAWQSNFGNFTPFPPALPNADGNANADLDINAADLAIWEEQFNNVPPGVTPWLEGNPNGRGLIMNNGRGFFNIVQNDTSTLNQDNLVGFSLVTSTDIAEFCAVGTGSICSIPAGTGALIMNNLDGANVTSDNIDSTVAGTANFVAISDSDLNNWNEFWITIIDNGGAAGGAVVNVYMNGSTAAAGTFNISLAAQGNATYQNSDSPFLEFGSSSNGPGGAIDTDFFTYKLGAQAPVAALSASVSSVPEPTSLVLLAMGAMGVCGMRRRRVR